MLSKQNTEKHHNPAATVVNKLAGLSRQLQKAYQRYQVRHFTREQLQQQITQMLKSKYPNLDPAEVINELKLRSESIERVRDLIPSNTKLTLMGTDLFLNQDNQIDVVKSIQQYTLKVAQTTEPPLPLRLCAYYGIDELIKNHYQKFKTEFLNPKHEHEELSSSFFLATLNGQESTQQLIWNIADQQGILPKLLSDDNFVIVAAGQASKNKQTLRFVTSKITELSITDEMRTPADNTLFRLNARIGNIDGLNSLWQQHESTEQKFEFFSHRDCYAFKLACEFAPPEGLAVITDFLLQLHSTEPEKAMPLMNQCFEHAMTCGRLNAVEKIYQTINHSPEQQRTLLNQTFLAAIIGDHIDCARYILDQASTFNPSPIDQEILHTADQFSESLPLINELIKNTSEDASTGLNK